MMTRTMTRMANSPLPVPTRPACSEESIHTQKKIDSNPNILPPTVPPRQTNPNTPRGSLSQTPRRLSLACLALAPLIALPCISRVFVDHLAPTIAQIATTNLERVFAWRDCAKPEEDLPQLHKPMAALDADDGFFEPNTTPSPTRTTPNPSKRHRGIIVRTDAVVRAARSGGRPSSFPAPALGARPAGLSLVGVSHFGTGLRDGDILTSVGGTPATSESLVVALVAGAIGQGAKVITGVVWRDDQRMDVAVEIPSPDAFTKKKPRRPSSVRD